MKRDPGLIIMTISAAGAAIAFATLLIRVFA